MKHSRYIPALAFAGLLALGGCVAMDDIKPASGTLLKGQLDETVEAVPSRADAQYIGMYTKLGDPLSFGRFASDRPDDFGFIMMAISNDMEAADVVTANNNYNWFSPCMELSSRNADYANPYIRYRGIYDEISRAHDVMNLYLCYKGVLLSQHRPLLPVQLPVRRQQGPSLRAPRDPGDHGFRKQSQGQRQGCI